MIYTRFATPVRIVGNFGEHKPDYLRFPLTLVLVEPTDEPTDQAKEHRRFYWADLLKADGGWPEIQHAINQANTWPLAAEQLAEAFRQAE